MVTVNFTLTIPLMNILHNMGVVYSCPSCPAYGSDAGRKMAEAIGKTNTRNLKKKSSLKDILKLEESHGLDENIRHFCTFLETSYLLSLFTIICPVDFILLQYTLKTRDGDAITYDLLITYRSITPTTVTLSTSWYNKYSYFMDAENNKHTLGRDMS